GVSIRVLLFFSIETNLLSHAHTVRGHRTKPCYKRRVYTCKTTNPKGGTHMKYNSYNIGYIDEDGQPRETQMDVPANLSEEEQKREVLRLTLNFLKENNIPITMFTTKEGQTIQYIEKAGEEEY